MLSLQLQDRTALILEDKFKFAMQVWLSVQSDKIYLSKTHILNTSITETSSLVMAYLPQSMKQSDYTEPLNYKHSKSVLSQKGPTQGLK